VEQEEDIKKAVILIGYGVVIAEGKSARSADIIANVLEDLEHIAVTSV
jgi:hypothetical protein